MSELSVLKEIMEFNELNSIQQEIIGSLLYLGFTFRYPRYLTHKEWGEIDLSRIGEISDVLRLVYELGRRSKAEEIKNALYV